jgi:hypothetical protein
MSHACRAYIREVQAVNTAIDKFGLKILGTVTWKAKKDVKVDLRKICFEDGH